VSVEELEQIQEESTHEKADKQPARASETERIRSPSVRSSELEKDLEIDGHRVSQLRCGSAPPLLHEPRCGSAPPR